MGGGGGTRTHDSADNNHLRVTTRDGRTAEYDPRRLKGVQVFREKLRAFAHGERVQFRLPHRELGVANGQFATIAALDPATGIATLRLCLQRELKMNLKFFPHLDHAMRSFARQSGCHVSLSRARHDALIFTDSREELPREISRTADKAIALDAIDASQIRLEASATRIRPTVQIATPAERINRPDNAQQPRQEPRMKM